MTALTAATNTFVFPVSSTTIFFARDTDAKREELEPVVLLTFSLPNALDERDLIEAANAVRGALNLRTIGWDSLDRTVMIRDRITRARIAQSVLEAVLLPRAQVSLRVQFLNFDSERTYRYGFALPTSYQIGNFSRPGSFRYVAPTFSSAMSMLAIGGGSTVFGIGLADATLFATYSNSFSRSLYDATVVVADRATANFHIGDKYPIAQTLYTGFTQTTPSIYNPVPQITLEDLGLVLKLTPRVNGYQEVALDLEADLKNLGTQTFNSIPAVAERSFKATITLREGQWAILAGLHLDSHTVNRSGLAGISQLPGLQDLFGETTRDTELSQTLLVIRPTITRLPMSGDIQPQFLLGSARGQRVLF
jgi:general secretion pathway protein D